MTVLWIARWLARGGNWMSSKKKPKPSEETQKLAIYIALVVQNAMEDFHHKHLSDTQMKELNPIIRNAICTALHAFFNYGKTDGDKKFVDWYASLIPEYWERPVLTVGFLGFFWN